VTLLSAMALTACTPTVTEVAPPPAPSTPEAPEADEETTPLDIRSPQFDDLDESEQIELLKSAGAKVYGEHCARCHQSDGQGLRGAFPPLVGPGQRRGDCGHHARLVRDGLIGELIAGGITYNSVMPPTALDDLDLAALLTYERTAWGNDLEPCLPQSVRSATEP